MPETPSARKPPTDRVLTVTVRRIIPAGLIVSLPDGREGLIRERELAWDAEARRGGASGISRATASKWYRCMRKMGSAGVESAPGAS